MVWIALLLLGFTAIFVALQTWSGRWTPQFWRYRGRDLTATQLLILTRPGPPFGTLVPDVQGGILAAYQADLLTTFPFRVFTDGVLMSLFLSFLLPLWSLSFAIEAIGGEREANSLIWLLSRPLPRPAIYLAKFVALLPWVLAFNLGGFALICLLAGPLGQLALVRFWPVVIWTSLAFAALFHLLGALVRRPAVVALVYVFFLEIILNLMPGFVKRASISYYARCMMFEAAADLGVGPERRDIFLPVSGPVALLVLAGASAGLLALGTVLFSRTQYQDSV
jgi:hypothetical protein